MLLAAPGPKPEPWQKSQASELDESLDETGENGAPKIHGDFFSDCPYEIYTIQR